MTIISGMRNDEVKDAILRYRTIRELGSYMLRNKGKTGSLVDSLKERIRGLAKLLICLRRRSNCHLALEEAL